MLCLNCVKPGKNCTHQVLCRPSALEWDRVWSPKKSLRHTYDNFQRTDRNAGRDRKRENEREADQHCAAVLKKGGKPESGTKVKMQGDLLQIMKSAVCLGRKAIGETMGAETRKVRDLKGCKCTIDICFATR
jgi:hypothetical protein